MATGFDGRAVKATLVLMIVTFYFMTSSITKFRPSHQENIPQITPKSFSPYATVDPESRDCHMMYTSNSCSVLPNFFTHPQARSEYSQSDPVIDFVHLAKTGGDTMRLCLRTLAERQGLRKPLAVDSDECSLFETLTNRTVYDIRDIDVIYGHKANGICELMNYEGSSQKCSSFTILREPFERMTSHYFYLRQRATNGEMTDNVNAQESKRLPIERWAIQAGSEMRNKFFASVDLRSCRNGTEGRQMEPLATFNNETFKQDIVDNFDRHFSVVGLTSEYSATLKILQRVYGLPFYDVCNELQINKGNYDNKTNTSMQQLKKDAILRLKSDARVRELLDIDVKIYERARVLFQKQVDMMNELT